MSSSRALILAISLSLASLGAPLELEASCAAPRPEPPMLVTPTESTVPPGGVVLLYLSTQSQRDTFHLVSEATHARAPVTPRALTAFVFAIEIPRDASAGRHAIEVTRAARGSSPYTPGTVVVGGTLPNRTLAAPSGRLVFRESPGRWSPSQSASLVLSTPAPANVAVVFRWTDAHGEHGNARWLTSGEEAVAVGSGHCGTSPFGSTVPAPGASFDVAFVDARGVLGPWAPFVLTR